MTEATWNDAYAALEQEYATVIAIQRAYDDFVRTVAERAGKRTRAAIRQVHEIVVDTDDSAAAGQSGLTVRLAGNLTAAGLDVRTWAAAPFGGPAGQMRACLYLNRDPAEGMPALDEMLSAARLEAGPRPDGLDDADVAEAEDLPLAVRSLDMATDGLSAALADAVIELVAIGERVGVTLLELRKLTPYALLLDALRKVHQDGELEQLAGTPVKLNKWSTGKDLYMGQTGSPAVWLTGLASGGLTIHWGTKRDQDEATRSRVVAALGGVPDDRLGYLGVQVMDTSELQAVIDDNDPAEAREVVKQRILASWRAWREVI